MQKICLIILTFFINIAVHAQQAASNFGNLQVHAGGSITGFGNFTNTSSASLINNGSIYVKADITNNQASMSNGTGSLYLDGNSSQAVNGTQPFKTNNLVTDNASGITLNNDISISGVHTFTAGLVTTSVAPNYLVYEAGSSYSGSNDSRHVNGWVKKIGNSNFIFPVGNAFFERPVAISNLSASAEFNCRYSTPAFNTNILTAPLVQVKSNEYWQLDKVSGGNAQVTLNWNHPKVAMDNVLVADILVAQYSGSWTSRGGIASGTVPTTGTITSASLSSFGSFTLGYKTYPIPLKLLSFTARRSTGTSYLKWITENEENADRFDIQRSFDGSLFTTIGNVKARNTNSLQEYNFQDHAALNGIAYYRLKSFDIDGKYSYSNIAVVSDKDINSTGIVVLNPAHNNITILNKTGREGAFTYNLFNAAGQLLSTGNLNMAMNAGAAIALPTGIASGTYYLEIYSGIERFTQKVLVQ